MSQTPSAMLLYGYELDGYLNRIADVMDDLYPEPEKIMNYLWSVNSGWKGEVHVEAVDLSGGRSFFLGTESSFVCESGCGVHEALHPQLYPDEARALRAVADHLGIESSVHPNWLMVVDFS